MDKHVRQPVHACAPVDAARLSRQAPPAPVPAAHWVMSDNAGVDDPVPYALAEVPS